MKTTARIIISSILFSLFILSASAQTTDTYFIVNKINGKIVSKAENGEKTINFDIVGLTTKPQVDEFITKFKSMRGVVSISVATVAVDGKWAATAVVYKYADKKYFQNLFTWLGIKYIMIDNTKYLTEELQSAKFE
jgi:predicted Zn-dependent protease